MCIYNSLKIFVFFFKPELMYSNLCFNEQLMEIIEKNTNRKISKRPIGLIGHMSKCSVAFAMYMYIHVNYISLLM